MAEAIVSAVVDQLVLAAAEWLKEEISLLKGVKPKLDNMKNKMQTIQTVLEDAENQSVKREIVKSWLKELRDVSYDMDDVLDEWSTRVHLLEREMPEAAKFSGFSLKKLNCFSSVNQLPWRRDIALRIKSINERVDSVSSKMVYFELASKSVRSDEMNKIINVIDRTTTSFVDETTVYDRDAEKDFLLRKVLSMNTEQEKSPQVISIVGIGGLGKTTLAQMVYNDGKVKEKFAQKRIWVCVSDPFDEAKVAKHILEGLKVDHTKMTSLQTLGGVLRSEVSVAKWTAILDSEIWELEKAEVDLFPHIFLSYQELPAMLKRCFLILAIFPKDTVIKVEDVIKIWMAHGFLNPKTKKDDMVNTGRKYLEFLVSRALLKATIFNQILMHDIINDFALHLLGDEIISVEVLDKIENDRGSISTSERGLNLKSTTVRHLYIDDSIDPPSIGFGVEKLRTCIIRKVAPNITSDLVKGLKMVRALYLANCDLKEVPPGIENLIHLRLLELSGNPLVELPETIGGLYNLQTLYLLRTGLSTLPDSIGKLTNSIFLIPDIEKLEKLPESVGKLINLQYLGRVPVEAGKSKMGFLGNLNQLRELWIEFKSEYGDEVDVKKAAIQKKEHITLLILSFNNHEVTDGAIAALQPPSNLPILEIFDLQRSSLPGWITSLHYLTVLRVKGAPNIWTLPPLGQLQSLKTLAVKGFSALKMIGRECWGQKNDQVFVAFPTLLSLVIWDCDLLEEWSDIKAEDEGKVTLMPKLESVNILDCQKLKVLPSRLLCTAASLKKIDCWLNNSSLGEYIKNDKLLGRVVNVISSGKSLRRYVTVGGRVIEPYVIVGDRSIRPHVI